MFVHEEKPELSDIALVCRYMDGIVSLYCCYCVAIQLSLSRHSTCVAIVVLLYQSGTIVCPLFYSNVQTQMGGFCVSILLLYSYLSPGSTAWAARHEAPSLLQR